MCLRNSRGSKDIRGAGENVRAQEGRKGFRGNEVNGSIEYPLEKLAEFEEVIERLLSWLKLD